MIYATFDIDVMDDPAFQDLADADPGHPWRFMRLIQIAKRANELGRVQRADGVPMDARSLARLHDGRGASVEVWLDFLALAITVGLVEVDSTGCYRICHWKRWHRAPSDEPDAVAERVRRHRTSKPETACNELQRTVTTCNGCNDTEQSRVEQSRVEYTPPTPPSGDGEGQIQQNGTSWPADDGFSSRLKSLERLEQRLGRPLKPAERRAAVNVLSRPTPTGADPGKWHSYLLSTLGDHLKRAFSEAQGGKAIGSAVSVACCRANEQIRAYLITNQAAN